MYLLRVVRGPDQGKSLRLEPGATYTLGCDDEASLRLSDPLVLKGHCSLAVEDGAVLLKNETASQPVYVGDKKVAAAKLGANTAFRVGDTTLQIVDAPAAPQTKPALAPDALIGKIVGGYKLQEVVGEGGMGKVYRATQLSLHRDVALKVLRDQVAKDAAFRELFINEARAAAQLVHPNVVQVYDAGTDGETSFFSMEFISQGSVEEILQREKTIPWERAILMVLEAAHGLDYAEGKQIVHHDIKPDNLMINGDGRVKIADLGLAKRGEGPRDKGIIGTPHFIPPEQALGKETDTRADIYSLGATFFRMITGRTLFTGKTAKEIVLKHIKEPPPAASSVDKSIPDEVDLVLARMLAKEPDQRYGTAKELIAALEEVCANHGIKGAIIKKGVGKRVMVPLVLLLLAAGGVAYYFASKGPVTVIDKKAQEERDQEARARKEAEERARLQELARREGDVKIRLGEIQRAELALKAEFSVDSVYDDRDKASDREHLWQQRARAYRDFADTEDAREFGLDAEALKAAEGIEKGLKDAKDAQETKRAEIEKRVDEITTLDNAQRAKLADLRQQRRFEAAANLCDAVPWANVLKWEWVNPVNGNRQPAMEIPAIRDAAKEAADYFAKEGKAVQDQALRDWQAIEQRYRSLQNDLENAPDDRLEAILAELKEVEERYIDPKATNRNAKIRAYAIGDKDSAKAYHAEMEKILKERHAARLDKDRVIVRHSQRRWCSLYADQTPNWVMNCDFSAAIADWSKLLQTDQVKTERYRRFADERITLLRWTEFLFARFQTDLAESIQKKDAGPFRTLRVDLPVADGERSISTSLDDATEDPYEIDPSKPYKGDDKVRLSRFPMDWLYHGLFHFEGECRWKEPPPAVEFALGAFAFETMQYKEAKRHFERLAGDARYGAVAQHLAKRAEGEQQAREEWEQICKAVNAATSVKELDELKGRMRQYAAAHEGRIFFLEVMENSAPFKREFHELDWPRVPEAPPPPPPPEK